MAELQRKAKEHLWLHFSSMGSYRDQEIPIIERGEGPYLFDVHGKRYLDMLSGLFTVQIGYSYGEELGQAALEQMRTLPYYTNWTFAHPPAAELAARLAGLAPPGINRAFFVSGGSEAVESAWKLARQYHAANGQPMRRKVIARKIAYHGTTMGALSITGITAIRTPFEPLVDGVRHVANTNRYRCKYCAESQECTLACADEVAETIEQEGPETVAMVIMEPVQNSGGTFTPHPDYHRRVREICDAYGVLQVADEVICGFGRLGEWFGCERYGYEPDLITCAKGLTSGYASLGALLISDRWPSRSSSAASTTCTASRSAATPWRLRSRGRTSTSWSAWTCSATCAPTRPTSRNSCTAWRAITRSSATCAAPATSCRSSWSRTARRGRRSP